MESEVCDPPAESLGIGKTHGVESETTGVVVEANGPGLLPHIDEDDDFIIQAQLSLSRLPNKVLARDEGVYRLIPSLERAVTPRMVC